MNPLNTQCHAKIAILITTITFATAAAPVQAEQSAETAGRQILAQTLEAHGGLDRFRAFGTLTYHTDGLPYSAAAPLSFDHIADLVARRHHMNGHSAKGPFTTASNDTQGWTTDADALGVQPRWVNHGNSYFVLMPFVFADPGANARSLGQRVYNGKTYDAIAITYGQNTGDTAEDDYILYIDPETCRLHLIDFAVTYGPMRGDTPIDQLPRRSIEFVEWQTVDGLTVPKVLHYAPWERTITGGRRAEQGVQYTVSNVDFDTPRPSPELFNAPPGATIE